MIVFYIVTNEPYNNIIQTSFLSLCVVRCFSLWNLTIFTYHLENIYVNVEKYVVIHQPLYAFNWKVSEWNFGNWIIILTAH